MNEVLRILAEWNPWWDTGKVPPDLSGKKRERTEEILSLAEAREVKVLTGVRRSGKSTLFYQVIEWLLVKQKIDPKKILLVNFEDEALSHFTLEQIFNTYQASLKPEGGIHIFLDEVQNKKGWERWVRKNYDLKRPFRFFVTGSSASLLAGEYATLLTGRNITLTIYPLSFRELLLFQDMEVRNLSLITQEKRNRIEGMLTEYLFDGGFPEPLRLEKTLKRRLLNQYFQDIVYRDIVYRHNCHPAKIKDLASFLLTNVSSTTSLRALRGALGFGLNLVSEYLGYLEDAFLLFQLYLYDASMKKQMANPRKIYAVDNGIRNAVAFKFSQDVGRLMENAVFMELKRRSHDVYYWKDRQGKETDFVVRKGLKVDTAIQVCFDPDDKKTLQREALSLESAMKAHGLKEGLILTMRDSEEIKKDGRRITLVPLYEWLLAWSG